MNKILYLFLLIFLFEFHCEAKQITQEQALSVARQALLSPSELRNADNDLQLVETKYENSQSVRSSGNILYYVYNRPENGYIIVAGDDLVYPVIGYSFTSLYDSENLPPNFQLWMEDVAYGISVAVKENRISSERTRLAWESYFNGNIHLRSLQSNYLLQTTWNQSTPFNLQCPLENRQRTVTGCVATAMAQIMKYHEYPQGILSGSIPGYTTANNKHFIAPISLSEQSYNWNIMSDNYFFYDRSESADEVAKLMYHCGVSIMTDYELSTVGSGAYTNNMVSALHTYFGYDKGIQSKLRSFYFTSDWLNMLITEIDAGRPVTYSGVDDKNAGHAFICDGYDSEGSFHFNWGWGGQLDGFFFIDNIDYRYYNDIQIGIQPNNGGKLPYEIVIGPHYKDFYPNISMDVTQINQKVDFRVRGSFWNIGSGTFHGSLGYVLLNKDYSFVSLLGYGNLDEDGLAERYFTGEIDVICNVPTSVPDGDYLIKAAVRETQTSNWQVINAYEGFVGELALRVGKGASIPEIEQTSSIFVYIEGEQICIESNEAETIDFYSMTGNRLTQIKKPIGKASVSVNSLPKGILVLKGSSGWVRKIFLKSSL